MAEVKVRRRDLGRIVPMLLVLAARRRGEYAPASVVRIIGQPIVAIVVIGVFMIGLVLHAFVIWTEHSRVAVA